MPKDNKPNLKDLEKKLEWLIKRFDEEKCIMYSYIKIERDWKREKNLHIQEQSSLEKNLNKVRN